MFKSGSIFAHRIYYRQSSCSSDSLSPLSCCCSEREENVPNGANCMSLNYLMCGAYVDRFQITLAFARLGEFFLKKSTAHTSQDSNNHAAAATGKFLALRIERLKQFTKIMYFISLRNRNVRGYYYLN